MPAAVPAAQQRTRPCPHRANLPCAEEATDPCSRRLVRNRKLRCRLASSEPRPRGRILTVQVHMPRHFPPRVAPAAGLALALLGPTALLRAQTGLTGGAVQGTVRNEAGVAVGGVAVSLAAGDIGVTRLAVTDAEGGYRFAALPLGTYRLRVEAAGYRPLEREGLTPTVGQVLVVDVTLALARSETI